LTGAGAFERNIEGSFRGRLGRAWDRLLLYGTAGVAVTSLRTRGAFNSNLVLGPTLAPIPGSSLTGVNSASDISKTFIGPTIGFGAEYAIARNITVGAEYRHTFYGSEAVFPGMTPTVTFAAAGGSVTTLGSQVSGSYRLDTDEVMVRVNFLSN
jgi:outer membrane immunogenic protein